MTTLDTNSTQGGFASSTASDYIYQTGVGKGYRETVSPKRTSNVFGAAIGTQHAVGWNSIPAIVSPATSFDFSSISSPCQSIAAVFGLVGLDRGGAAEIRLTRLIDDKVDSYSHIIPNPPQGSTYWDYYYITRWWGYTVDAIAESGDYLIEFFFEGTLYDSKQIHITMPASLDFENAIQDFNYTKSTKTASFSIMGVALGTVLHVKVTQTIGVDPWIAIQDITVNNAAEMDISIPFLSLDPNTKYNLRIANDQSWYKTFAFMTPGGAPLNPVVTVSYVSNVISYNASGFPANTELTVIVTTPISDWPYVQTIATLTKTTNSSGAASDSAIYNDLPMGVYYINASDQAGDMATASFSVTNTTYNPLVSASYANGVISYSAINFPPNLAVSVKLRRPINDYPYYADIAVTSGTTNSSGALSSTISCPGLSPGTYNFSVYNADYTASTNVVVVAPTINPTFGSCSVTGNQLTFTVNGFGAGTFVSVFVDGGSSVADNFHVDSNGSYTDTLVDTDPAGIYTITAYDQNGHSCQKTFTVQASVSSGKINSVSPSPTTPNVGDKVTVSIQVTNNTNIQKQALVTAVLSGSTTMTLSKPGAFTIDANGTDTVTGTFTMPATDVDVTIELDLADVIGGVSTWDRKDTKTITVHKGNNATTYPATIGAVTLEWAGNSPYPAIGPSLSVPINSQVKIHASITNSGTVQEKFLFWAQIYRTVTGSNPVAVGTPQTKDSNHIDVGTAIDMYAVSNVKLDQPGNYTVKIMIAASAATVVNDNLDINNQVVAQQTLDLCKVPDPTGKINSVKGKLSGGVAVTLPLTNVAIGNKATLTANVKNTNTTELLYHVYFEVQTSTGLKLYNKTFDQSIAANTSVDVVSDEFTFTQSGIYKYLVTLTADASVTVVDSVQLTTLTNDIPIIHTNKATLQNPGHRGGYKIVSWGTSQDSLGTANVDMHPGDTLFIEVTLKYSSEQPDTTWPNSFIELQYQTGLNTAVWNTVNGTHVAKAIDLPSTIDIYQIVQIVDFPIILRIPIPTTGLDSGSYRINTGIYSDAGTTLVAPEWQDNTDNTPVSISMGGTTNSGIIDDPGLVIDSWGKVPTDGTDTVMGKSKLTLKIGDTIRIKYGIMYHMIDLVDDKCSTYAVLETGGHNVDNSTSQDDNFKLPGSTTIPTIAYRTVNIVLTSGTTGGEYNGTYGITVSLKGWWTKNWSITSENVFVLNDSGNDAPANALSLISSISGMIPLILMMMIFSMMGNLGGIGTAIGGAVGGPEGAVVGNRIGTALQPKRKSKSSEVIVQQPYQIPPGYYPAPYAAPYSPYQQQQGYYPQQPQQPGYYPQQPAIPPYQQPLMLPPGQGSQGSSPRRRITEEF